MEPHPPRYGTSLANATPARTNGEIQGPDHLLAGDFSRFWIYTVGPLAGALLAVAISWILRGKGGQRAAEEAAQGSLPG